MSNNHNITRNIGNLRGFSTDSDYIRPPNVATNAINLQRAPDNTLQLRRGYQCQIAAIGGNGIGTFDDPTDDDINTVCLGLDGYLYNKVTRQIYFYYNGEVTGPITMITETDPATVTSMAHGLLTGTYVTITNVGGMVEVNNQTYIIDVTGPNEFNLYSTVMTGVISFADTTNPCKITSVAHGLSTGQMIMIDDVYGMTELNKLSYTITVIDVNNFTLDGIDATLYTDYISGGTWFLAENSILFSAYTSGGVWTIAYTQFRYLVMSIFTDPRYIYSPIDQSITCDVIVNRMALVDLTQTNTNTINVEFGHDLVATETIQFYSSDGVFQQRVLTSVTPFSLTFGGTPVNVSQMGRISIKFMI